MALRFEVVYRSNDFFSRELVASNLGGSSLVGDRNARVATAGTPSITYRTRLSFFRYQGSTRLLVRKVGFLHVERNVCVVRFLLHRKRDEEVLCGVSLYPVEFYR